MVFKGCRQSAGKRFVLAEDSGSTMVEAAVVFPLVILTLAMMLSFLVYLFDETASCAQLRRAVVEEAGRTAGTVTLCREECPASSVNETVYHLHPCEEGEQTVTFRSRMPGVADRSAVMSAHQYICNEKTQIRLWDLFQ